MQEFREALFELQQSKSSFGMLVLMITSRRHIECDKLLLSPITLQPLDDDSAEALLQEICPTLTRPQTSELARRCANIPKALVRFASIIHSDKNIVTAQVFLA